MSRLDSTQHELMHAGLVRVRHSSEGVSSSRETAAPESSSVPSFVSKQDESGAFSVGLQAKFEKLLFLAREEKDSRAALQLAVLTSKLGTSEMKADAVPTLVGFPETLPVIAEWLADSSREVRMSAATSIRGLRHLEISEELASALRDIDTHIIWKAFGKLGDDNPKRTDSQFLEAACMALDGNRTSYSLVLLRKLSEHPNPGVHFVARMFLDIRENTAA